MRKKKRSRVALAFFSFIVLLLAGLLAIVVWLYRGDIDAIFRTRDGKVSSQENAKPSQEILEEERKQLEDILKRR